MFTLKQEPIIKLCDKVIEFCIYGFLFFTPISVAIIETCVGISIFFFLVKKISEKKFPVNKLNLFLLIYFIALLLSAYSSTYLQVSMRTIFAKILHYVAFYFVISDRRFNAKTLNKVITVISLSLLLVCINGFQQYFTHFDFIRHQKWPWDKISGRITSCFTTPNGFGAYLVIFLPVIFSSWLFLKEKVYKIYFLIVFNLGVICLLLTGTRSSLLAFVASFLALFVYNYSKKEKFYLMILTFLIFFILAFFLVPTFKNLILGGLNLHDTSSIDRKLLWQMSFNMLKSAPIFGVGIGTFMQNFSKYNLFGAAKQVCYAHNSYLQIIAESGIFGFCSFLLLILAMVYNCSKLVFKKCVVDYSYLEVGFVASFIAFLINAFFDNHFYSLTFALLFWFLTGVIISMSSHDSR